MKRPRVLFVLKLRENYGTYSSGSLSSGLYNSAMMVRDMLESEGIAAKLVQVIDANCIDREVHAYKPTHVIIEALWVPPAKFAELEKLHKNVQWTVRVHSEIPFLAQEGMAIGWLKTYTSYPKVDTAFNSPIIYEAFRALFNPFGQVKYLPNFFPVSAAPDRCDAHDAIIEVGCFGAIRGLKSQLIQAFAAIQYADKIKKKLRFHVNIAYHGGHDGGAVLKNIRALFAGTRHSLVEHEWLTHDNFMALLSRMDISLQVSFSETFNIVTAHAVNLRVPVVVSPEIDWVTSLVHADPTDVDSIVSAMGLALDCRYNWAIERLNVNGLRRRSRAARKAWLAYIGG